MAAFTTIAKPNSHFDIVQYTGNGTMPREIDGLNFKPDMLLFCAKNNGSIDHGLFDSTRGGNKIMQPNRNYPNNNGAAVSDHGVISSFDSDGFTVNNGSSGSYPKLQVNDNSPFGGSAAQYITYCWKNGNGGTTTTNNDGNVAVTLQANTTAGMSIGTYTGTGTTGRTLGHGLGKTPQTIWIKQTNASGSWKIHHRQLSSFTEALEFNQNSAESDSTTGGVQSANTSTFTLGNGAAYNDSGDTYIFYAFAEVQGFSKFGYWRGNGSSDGPFCYTGFKPAFVLQKEYNGTGNWRFNDSNRDTTNPIKTGMNLNEGNQTDFTQNSHNFYSNGFKIIDTGGGNTANDYYVYWAFAETPAYTSNNLPATAVF